MTPNEIANNASNFATRFAPSPTGGLHIGHAFSAIICQDIAQQIGAKLYLRIEDIDTERCKETYTDEIIGMMAWLGIEFEPFILRQSNSLGMYKGEIRKLMAKGVIYRCYKTRKELQSTPPAPLSQDEELRLDQDNKPFAWRLSLQRCRDLLGQQFNDIQYTALIKNDTNYKQQQIKATDADWHALGDVVLARKDAQTSYHIACVHDDAYQKMSHIIRGEDLRDVTFIHRLLQILLDYPEPIYHFHPLILDPETGKKFAKRDKSPTLHWLRATGETPASITHRLKLHFDY